MVKRIKNRKAASLIEMIMVILVIGIISAIACGVVIYFVQMFIYSPRQLDVEKIALEVSKTMIEGDPDIRGLRFTREIIDASDAQFSYTYGYPTAADQLSVRYRWDNTDGHIYRSTSTDDGSNWSAESPIPYYIPSSITIDGKTTTGVIFNYTKAGDVDWVSGSDPLADIRRVVIDITVTTGTGEFSNFQGRLDITSSVEIKDYS